MGRQAPTCAIKSLFFDSWRFIFFKRLSSPDERLPQLFHGEEPPVEASHKNEIETVFRRSIHVVKECLGRSAFKPKRALNAAVFDAVMVGIARRLEASEPDCDELKSSYERLLANENFIKVSERSTTDEENVASRLRLATEAFAQVHEAS